MIDHYFLHVNVLKSIGITDKLSLIVNSFLVGFERVRSSSIWAWTHIMDSFWCNTSCDESADECYGVWGSAIYGDVLWLFHSFEELHVLGIRWEALIEIRVIYRVDTFYVIFVFVVRRMCKAARDEALCLKQGVNQANREDEDVEGNVCVFIDEDSLFFLVELYHLSIKDCCSRIDH